MAGGSAKTKRAHELLSDAQKRTILEMWDRDADSPGAAMGFVLERFGGDAFGLTPEAVREIIAAERRKKRAKDNAATDWAKRFEVHRSAG